MTVFDQGYKTGAKSAYMEVEIVKCGGLSKIKGMSCINWCFH